MAIYGITAGRHELLLKELFQKSNLCACYKNMESPLEPFVLRQFGAEDVIFIKTFSPQSGLKVKAVGIVLPGIIPKSDFCDRIPVQWLWKGNKVIDDLDDNCPDRNESIYEEFNPWVQREIMDLLPVNYSRLPTELPTPAQLGQESQGISM